MEYGGQGRGRGRYGNINNRLCADLHSFFMRANTCFFSWGRAVTLIGRECSANMPRCSRLCCENECFECLPRRPYVPAACAVPRALVARYSLFPTTVIMTAYLIFLIMFVLSKCGQAFPHYSRHIYLTNRRLL